MGWNNLFNFSFEATPRCNLNCGFCYNVWKHDSAYPQGELSLDQIRRLFDKTLFGLPTETIHLTGGEPLLRDDLEEIVEYFTKKNMFVAISTNGTLLNDARLDTLLRAGAKRFELTLLGPQAAVHDHLCGQPGSFAQICQAVTSIRKRGIFVRIAMTATSQNIDYASETAAKAFELGAGEFIMYRFVPTNGNTQKFSHLLPTSAQIKAAISKLDDCAETSQLPIKIGIPIPPCELDGPPKHIHMTTCMGGVSKFIIDPTGNLRLCEQSSQTHGNLFEESFFFKPFSKPARSFIRQIPAECASCDQVKKCRGGCRMLTPTK